MASSERIKCENNFPIFLYGYNVTWLLESVNNAIVKED